MWRPSPGLVAGLCLATLTSRATAAPATPADAGPGNDPLRRNYVDLGINGGPTWLGSVGDGRWSPVGIGFGTRLSVGRAPYWGCVYVDVGFFSARDGVVDPRNNERPDLVTTSAGWCGKVAIRLTPRLYLFPMVGAGFGVLDYSAGFTGRHSPQDLIQARVLGLGVQAEATLVYRWRFAALTLQPIRATAYLFEHLDTYNNVNATGSVWKPIFESRVG